MSWRLPVLDSSRADPWSYTSPTTGYAEAAEHLLAVGLAPAPNIAALRDMWCKGGNERRLAGQIAERWKLVAV